MTPPRLSCAACEEQIADLLDGVLTAALKAEVEAHLADCAACAELLRDASGAMHLMERASAVEVPTALVPQILAEITTGPSRVLVQSSLAERVLSNLMPGRWIRPLLQPRFALGFAMAALSIAFVPRTWLPLVASPGKILTIAENRIYRTFDRAMKSYDNLAVVADVQNRLQDQIEDQMEAWRDQDQNEGAAPSDRGERQ